MCILESIFSMIDQGSTSTKAFEHWGLWCKCKGLWQSKVIISFYTVNCILRVKKSEHNKPL